MEDGRDSAEMGRESGGADGGTSGANVGCELKRSEQDAIGSILRDVVTCHTVSGGAWALHHPALNLGRADES